jgi:hypothetical protein
VGEDLNHSTARKKVLYKSFIALLVGTFALFPHTQLPSPRNKNGISRHGLCPLFPLKMSLSIVGSVPDSDAGHHIAGDGGGQVLPLQLRGTEPGYTQKSGNDQVSVVVLPIIVNHFLVCNYIVTTVSCLFRCLTIIDNDFFSL